MNLGKEVIKLLRQTLAEKKNVRKNKTEIIDVELSIDNVHLHAVIKDFDTYSILLEEIQFNFSRESKELNLNSDDLNKCAKNLAKKVTYLLENLSLIEEDSLNNKVQLRSVFTENDKALLSYYEIIMCGNGSVSLARYQNMKDQRQRIGISFNLTNEVLEKLVNDIARCIII